MYAALRSPEEGSWTDRRNGTAWRNMQMFNVRQPLAVLLAAFERFEEDDRAGFGRFLHCNRGSVVSIQRDLQPGSEQRAVRSMYQPG